jgi:hypothetical protein
MRWGSTVRLEVLALLHFLPSRGGRPKLRRCRAQRGYDKLDEPSTEERAERSLWVLRAA